MIDGQHDCSSGSEEHLANDAPTSCPDGKGEFAVGYRKPPVGTRFQPGQSGNPAGRPRKPTDLASLLRDEVQQEVIGPDGRRVSRFALSIQIFINKALAGDLSAMKQVLDLAATYSLTLPKPPTALTGVVHLPIEIFRASSKVQNRFLEEMARKRERETNGRFAKGFTGNPGGRPKHAMVAAQILERCLNTRIEFQFPDNNKQRIRRSEALMFVLAEQAASGDARALALVQKTLARLEAAEDKQRDQPQGGVIIIPEPCKSDEEWEQLYGAGAAQN